jgi:hypothetical protein
VPARNLFLVPHRIPISYTRKSVPESVSIEIRNNVHEKELGRRGVSLGFFRRGERAGCSGYLLRLRFLE